MTWTTKTQTLAGTANQISLSTTKAFLDILHHVIGISGTGVLRFLTDGDTGTKYADTYAVNGGADVATGSLTSVHLTQFGAGSYGKDTLDITFGLNISGDEKIFISFAVGAGTDGAGNAPDRQQTVFKSIVSALLSTCEINLTSSETQGIGSNMTVLETD